MGLMLVVGVTAGLIYWNERLRRRLGYGWMRLVSWLLGLGLLDAIVGTTLGLIRAFQAVQTGDASTKATRLSQGVSDAMQGAAIQGGVMAASLLMLVTLQIVASIRSRR